MSVPSIEYAILQSLLQIGQAAVPEATHNIRELPKVTDTIDFPLPCVIYTPQRATTSDPASFEGDALRTYFEEVVIVDGREGDASFNMQQALAWKESIRIAIEKVDLGDGDGLQFRVTLPDVPQVWSVEVAEAGNFDRSKLNSNYAYLPIQVTLKTME